MKKEINSKDKIEEYIMPAECEKSEQELEQISIEERKSHYKIINFFVLVVNSTCGICSVYVADRRKKDLQKLKIH